MKPREKTKPLWPMVLRPLGVGLCVGMVCCTLLLLLAAAVLSATDIPHGAVAPMAVCAAGCGAFAAGLSAALVAGRRGLLWGAVCGALLFVCVLLAGVIRSGGVDGGFAIVKAAVLTLCGAVGGLIGVNRKR